MNKLHLMLEEETRILYKCSYCNGLFTQRQQDKFVCPKAKIFIDFHGKVIANHVFDRSFDIKKFINFLRQTMKYTWKEIYWKIYAHTVDFDCKTCGKKFNGATAKQCSYHTGKAMYSFGSNKGTYTCWGQETMRFGSSKLDVGCMTQDHEPSSNSDEFAKLIEVERVDSSQEPFRPKINNNKDLEACKVFSDAVIDLPQAEPEAERFKCITDAIKRYLKDNKSSLLIIDEDEDEPEKPQRSVSKSPGRKVLPSRFNRAFNGTPLRMRSNSKLEANKAEKSMTEKKADPPMEDQNLLLIKKENSKSNIVDDSKDGETKEETEKSDEKQGDDTQPASGNANNQNSSKNLSPKRNGKRRKKGKALQPVPPFLNPTTQAARDFMRDAQREQDQADMQ